MGFANKPALCRIVGGNVLVRSLTFKLLDKEAETNLISLFPEYKAAVNFQKQGNIPQAITALSRVQEVLVHAVGKEDPLSSQITLQLASLHRAQGTFEKAIQLVQRHPSTMLDYRVEKEVFIASTELSSHNITQALQHAKQAVHICEQEQDFANPDNMVFSRAYSSLGEI
ncbi:tetratricopeptide repeat protein [archaeon]|nr:MAG: tetratricopeptide repeat protein [archaeon]